MVPASGHAQVVINHSEVFMSRKILFSILILVSFFLLIYLGEIPKAGEKTTTKQFVPISSNPTPALSSDPLRGDANGNGEINAGDVVYLIMYFFKDGPPPLHRKTVMPMGMA